MKKEQLFAYITQAFTEYHPKFPWPKKNGLNEQSDDFKMAFNALCNALAGAEEVDFDKRLKSTVEMYSNLVSGHMEREKNIYIKNKDLERELKSARFKMRIFQGLFFVVVVLAILSTAITIAESYL